jgi:1,2-diacylglycerol 3-beta-glucosyltransferase
MAAGCLVPLIVLFGVGPFILWGPLYRARCERRLSRRAAIGLGLCHWVYSYLQCVAAWLAFLRLIRSRSDWQKTSRITGLVKEGPAPGTGQFGQTG